MRNQRRHFQLFFAFLFILLSLPVGAQTPFTFSERVGSEIDSMEAQYFPVFMQLHNLESARLSERGGDSVQVGTRRWVRGVLVDSTLVVARKNLVRVGDILDNYESISQRDSLPNLVGLGNIIRPLFPTLESPKLHIYTLDGREYTNEIFGVTDSGLYFWDSERGFNWRDHWKSIGFIPASDLSRIRGGGYATYLSIGGVVGTGIGITGQVVYPTDGASTATQLGTALSVGSVGVNIAYWLHGKNVTLNGDLETFSAKRGTLNRLAALKKAFPPELAREESPLENVTSLNESGRGASHAERQFITHPLFQFSVGFEGIYQHSEPLTTTILVSARDQPVSIEQKYSEGILLEAGLNVSSHVQFALQTMFRTGPVEDSSRVARFTKVLGFEGKWRGNLIEKEDTDGLFESTLLVSSGVHLFHFELKHTPILFFSNNLAYDELIPHVALSLGFRSSFFFSDRLSLMTQFLPTLYLPLRGLPAERVTSAGSTSSGTYVDYGAIDIPLFGTIRTQVGISYLLP